MLPHCKQIPDLTRLAVATHVEGVQLASERRCLALAGSAGSEASHQTNQQADQKAHYEGYCSLRPSGKEEDARREDDGESRRGYEKEPWRKDPSLSHDDGLSF
jgi:hypothetical protein